MRNLTKKQDLFATEYVKQDDASKAYRIAYNTSRMKAETINRNAHELLKNNKIATRVRELKDIAAEVAKEKFKIDSEEITRHLNILRNSRIDEYVQFVKKEKGEGKDKTYEMVLEFKPFNELTEEQLMCIESIKETRYGIELKLHGKEWTIEKINKHIGYYEKDNKQKTLPPRQIIDMSDYKGKIHD